jgi:glutathionylspermidine synthase
MRNITRSKIMERKYCECGCELEHKSNGSFCNECGNGYDVLENEHCSIGDTKRGGYKYYISTLKSNYKISEALENITISKEEYDFLKSSSALYLKLLTEVLDLGIQYTNEGKLVERNAKRFKEKLEKELED